MKKIFFFLPALVLGFFVFTQNVSAACVPCPNFDALCGLDCECTTSTGGCGYEDGFTPSGLNCNSPYVQNSTGTSCICGSDSCCQADFGAGAVYNGNDTDGCTCAENATWNGSQCVLDECGGDYIKHTNGTCICGSDSCCQRIFGEAVYDGNGVDGCTCAENASYDGSQCVLNECGNDYIRHSNGVCICGDNGCCQRIFGPGAIFDGNGTDGCACSAESTWDGSQCVVNDEAVFSASFFSTDTPIIANGQGQGHIQVDLYTKNGGVRIPASFSVDYSTTGKKGSVEVTSTDGTSYYVTYTSPNLIGSSISSGKDVLYVHYTDPATNSATYKTFDIPLAVGTDITVKKYGFNDGSGNVVIGSGNAKVKVVAGASKTPVNGATVYLPNDPIGKTTDSSGFAYLSGGSGSVASGEATVVLSLSNEVSSLRSEGQANYRTIGIKRRGVYDFITNVDDMIAAESSEDEIKRLLNGLRRTNYSLFFIKKAKEIGYDTSGELAESIDGALSDLNDLFDITGKVTDKILGKTGDFVNKHINTSAVTSLKNSLDGKIKKMTQKLFEKTLRVFGHGVARFARDFPQSWLTDTFDDIKSSVFDDYLYKPAGGALNLKSVVKNSLKKNIDGKMYELMGLVENNIRNKNWGTGHIDSDLSRAKSTYVNLMDNYLVAHEVNYNVTIQKAAAESLLNAANDTIGMIPAYGKYVEGVETAYKAIRSAYLNNKQIYYWFDITGKVMKETEKSVKHALGGYSSSIFIGDLLASLADVSDSTYNSLMEYDEAQLDNDFYSDLLDIAKTMQSIASDDDEVGEIVDDLNDKQDTAEKTASSISSSLGSSTVNDLDEARQAQTNDFEYDTNLPSGDSCFSDTGGHKYETAVCYVQGRGVVQGYPDGTYKPDQAINRAEFTKIIMASTYDANQLTGASCFSDVSSEWFAPYVCAARNKYIVSGNPDGTFRPANNIVLAEGLKIILEAAAKDAGFEIPNASGEWYQKYFNLANEINLIDTIDNTPGHSMTRGEMAELMYRAENN